MTTKRTPQKGRKRAPQPKQEKAINAASGKLYAEAVKGIPAERERFVRATKGESSAEDTLEAWLDFGTLCARVFRSGRLWEPETVAALAGPLLYAAADLDEVERIVAAYDAAGDYKQLVARITSPFASTPTLEHVVKLTRALDADEEMGRRLAGYLPAKHQPYGREELAAAIALVLAHPETPVDIINGLHEGMATGFETVADEVEDTAPSIVMYLDALAKKGGAKK